MGAVAALTLFGFAKSAVAQHKEDPVGPPAPAPTEKRQLAPQAGPTQGRDVFFHASDANAQLEVRYPEGWRVLCEHPCAARAFIGAEYRVAGDGIIASRTFSIYPNPGPLVLRADVASNGARGPGIAMTIAGGLALLAGGIWAGGELAGCAGCNQAQRNEAVVPGVLVATGGAVLLIFGIVHLAMTKTALWFGPALSGARGTSSVRTVAERRGPSWLILAGSW
jgi:hypothetical protein